MNSSAIKHLSNRGLAFWAWALFVIAVVGTGLGVLSATVLGEEGDDLRLDIHLAQTMFGLSEPVIAQLALVNPSSETIQIETLSFETETIGFSIKPEGGEFTPYELGFVEEPFAFPIDLGPDESARAIQVILFNGRSGEMAFPTPGDYTIKAEYIGFLSVEPRPNPVEFDIVVVANDPAEPTGEALFSQRSTFDFLQNASREASTITALQDLITNEPDSLFANYARFYLALHEARNFTDKPEDLTAAVALMEGADVDGFQLRPEVVLQLGDWKWLLGDVVEANALLDRVVDDFPDTPAAIAAAALKAERDGVSPPEPPPAEGVPIEAGDVRDAIELALNTYFNAIEALDSTAALAVLDSGFLYNGVLDKTVYGTQLAGEFAEITGEGGTLTVDRTTTSLTTTDPVDSITNAVANVDVTPLIDAEPVADASEVQITLVEDTGVWFISAWEVQN